MDISGKTVVVTGATSGLGQAAAIDFAKSGANVVIVGRDPQRARETAERAGTGGGEATIVVADLSTRAGVGAAAAAILERTRKVDVLVNNAGGTFPAIGFTSDGLERTFALNTLAAYLLERELHGSLREAKGRVVNVATGLLDWFPVDVAALVSGRGFTSMGQYGRSKLASVMMTVEQANRFAPEGLTFVALHPGVIMGTRFGGGQSEIAQAIAGPLMRAVGFACTIEEAVRRFRVACFENLPSGTYLVKGKPAPLPKQARDAAVRQEVVALLERLSLQERIVDRLLENAVTAPPARARSSKPSSPHVSIH